MNNQQVLLKLLEIISQRVQYHHDALWEEAKHYSWWVYSIFAGLISLYIYFRLSGFVILEPCPKAWLMWLCIIGSAFGAFISMMGFNAVRLESEYFNDARCVRKHILKKLKVERSIIREFDLIGGKAFGIRCGFKLTFLITAVLFIVFGVFSVLTLLYGS